MSYILDALRKSENERQREASATLSHAPQAATSSQTPVSTWLVMLVMTIALLAVGAAWWQSNRETPAAADTSTPQQQPLLQPGPSVAETVPVETPAAALPATAAAPSPVRSIGELENYGPSLPDYRLELLAFNEQDPSSSSAWINGRRYYTGEQIGSGPELIEIRSDGVILAFAGQRFLLTTR